jgi:ABC-type amino acid transport substrate-binding protein
LILFSVHRDTFFYEKKVMEERMKRILFVALLSISVLVLAACGRNQETNTFVVGLECDYAPFNWTTSTPSGELIDGINAYCDGYDIAIAQQIADGLGRELVIRKIDWDGLIPALNSGIIDAIIAGMSPTEVRKEVVSFSDEYFRSDQVLIVQAGSSFVGATSLASLGSISVIAQRGTLQDDLISQIPGATRRDPLDNYAALVQQVVSGITDALIAESAVATAIVANNPSLIAVRFPAGSGFTLQESDVTVSVAVRINEAATLIPQINAILAGISQAEREELMTQALDNQPSS